MPKQFRGYHMSIIGLVAVLNMVAIGALAITVMYLTAEGIPFDETPLWKKRLLNYLFTALLVLSFPVATPAAVATTPSEGVLLPILVPLNAYFWGWLVNRLVAPSASLNGSTAKSLDGDVEPK